jgi:hypothetical protein
LNPHPGSTGLRSECSVASCYTTRASWRFGRVSIPRPSARQAVALPLSYRSTFLSWKRTSEPPRAGRRMRPAPNSVRPPNQFMEKCAPYREPMGDRFSPAPRMCRTGLVDCAALAAAPVNVVRCRRRILAGREGVEPSRASFGDSSDLRITTFDGATGGIRTRTSALATRQSASRLPTAYCLGGIRTLTLALNRRSHCRDCATRHRSIWRRALYVEVQGVEP